MQLPSNSSPPLSHLLQSLIDVTRTLPVARKRLMSTDINYGRELLVTLARHTGGWIGWEATTLRTIAEELAFVALADRGVRVASDIEVGVLVNRAFANTLTTNRTRSRFVVFERNVGFRRALRNSLLEVRMAGISATTLRERAPHHTPAADLATVLEEYEHLLKTQKLADSAELFRVAIETFANEAPFVLTGTMFLAPSLAEYGLPGELLRQLVAYGAQMLEGDAGLPVAAYVGQLDFFAAATPSEELREVFRRVMAEGLRWDEVEIATTDPDTYGIALDALCQHIGTGATMLRGVSLSRTRLGRALERWFAWLEDGLPANTLRQSLEAGDLQDPTQSVSSTAIARELRAQRIGWGRDRYEAAIRRIMTGDALSHMKRHDDETDDEFAARRTSRVRSLAATAALLRRLIDIIPDVPQRGVSTVTRTSCAALATATLGWLDLIALRGPSEENTTTKLRTRLQQLADADQEVVPFAVALATLREMLSDVRAWPLIANEHKLWRSTGGLVHLTDLVHAGTTGRRRTFVVGLDADRVDAAIAQDPLLPDSVRLVISPDTLFTSSVRKSLHDRAVNAALSSIRGRVTFSYAVSSALEGREAGPSTLMLQAWRLQQGDSTLSFEKLRAALTPPASAIPVATSPTQLRALLDARDVWMDALADSALLLNGDAQVREAFPMLAAGLSAATMTTRTELTPYHGVVPEAAQILDPTLRPDVEISPSALERLASCPLSWLYRYGLSIWPPEDPVYDADHWLDAMQRGSLLHEVFERFITAYQGHQHDITTPEARDQMMSIVDDCIARWRDDVPPPGEAIFMAEAVELRGAALAFLQMERQLADSGDTARWAYVELAFGDGAPGGRYELPDGTTIGIRGRADRVDELHDKTLRVIDYKTGGTHRYTKSPKTGPFNGGRQLQPALYAAVLEQRLGQPVSRFEYRFPTPKGKNDIVAYSADELAQAKPIIDNLLAHVRAGEFIPTQDPNDCRFCEYAPICRTQGGEYTTISPRAQWAADNAEQLPSYSGMLDRRSGEVMS
jgi:RecB family exonuclease